MAKGLFSRSAFNESDWLFSATSTKGGSRDTLEKAETVVARGWSPSLTVTTVTPLGHRERAALKSPLETVTLLRALVWCRFVQTSSSSA